MKKQNNGGFSLVEVLLAMAILAAIVIPVCTGIVLSVQVNTRANDILRTRVAVSSAVETLMAQGIPWDYQGGDLLGEEFAELGLQVKIEQYVAPQTQEETGENPEETPQEAPKPAFFLVTVSDRETDPLVTITTKIRAVEPPAETVPDEGDNAKAPDGQGGAK